MFSLVVFFVEVGTGGEYSILQQVTTDEVHKLPDGTMIILHPMTCLSHSPLLKSFSEQTKQAPPFRVGRKSYHSR